jgi:hypothetical protein
MWGALRYHQSGRRLAYETLGAKPIWSGCRLVTNRTSTLLSGNLRSGGRVSCRSGGRGLSIGCREACSVEPSAVCSACSASRIIPGWRYGTASSRRCLWDAHCRVVRTYLAHPQRAFRSQRRLCGPRLVVQAGLSPPELLALGMYGDIRRRSSKSSFQAPSERSGLSWQKLEDKAHRPISASCSESGFRSAFFSLRSCS